MARIYKPADDVPFISQRYNDADEESWLVRTQVGVNRGRMTGWVHCFPAAGRGTPGRAVSDHGIGPAGPGWAGGTSRQGLRDGGPHTGVWAAVGAGEA